MFCPTCGNQVGDDQKFCHHCGANLGQPAGGGEPEGAAVAMQPGGAPGRGREKTPWEERRSLGFFRAVFRTMNEVLFRPSEFFRKMPVSGGLTDPLLFGLIIGTTGIMFSYLWQILMQGAIQDVMPGMEALVGQTMLHGVGLALLALLSPLLVIAGIFVSAGILHACLLLVKGAKSGFEATFRVVAYGHSANIFFVLPFCGNLLVFVWVIVLSIIGLREAHATTGGKAAFAVFLPLLLFCGLLLFGVALFLSAAAGSFGWMMHMQK